MKYLVFDASNILYRTFYAHVTEDDITVAGLASHTALVTLNKYYKAHRPDKVVMCFDRYSWRKDYTASDECLSGKPYKGNRRQNLTAKQKERYQLFLKHVDEFEHMMAEYTSVICLADEGLEADDLMAGIVQVKSVTDPDDEIIILSADKDMMQLLKHPNVRLIDPATGNDRTLKDWNNDANLFMFEKCLRGDAGDNVQSAYPRVRKTRIWKAYEDDYERSNVMMTEWINQEERRFKVQDLFKENKLLMDLESQPDHIQKKVVNATLKGLNNPGSFSYFNFLQFLGKYELKRIADSVENFVPLLSR